MVFAYLLTFPGLHEKPFTEVPAAPCLAAEAGKGADPARPLRVALGARHGVGASSVHSSVIHCCALETTFALSYVNHTLLTAELLVLLLKLCLCPDKVFLVVYF